MDKLDELINELRFLENELKRQSIRITAIKRMAEPLLKEPRRDQVDEITQLRDRVMDMEADIRAALVLIEDILDDDISALARSDVLALKGHLEDLVPDSLVCSICGAPAKYIANNERRCNEHKRVEAEE